ncbi:MAG: hypothetical protein GXX86_00925 [Propionibacterium sp.]|nr:hypothetical protein [Propionibacterium sp.]
MPIFTNNNLHGSTPPRVKPRLGEWGPLEVPAYRAKRRARVLVWLGFVVGLIVVTLMGWYLYAVLTGSKFLWFDLY